MKRLVKILSLVIALTLLASSLPVLSEDAHSTIRTESMRDLLALKPELAKKLALLPKASLPIKSVSMTSKMTVEYNVPSFKVKAVIKPATERAFWDFSWSYDSAKVTRLDWDFEYKKSGLEIVTYYRPVGVLGTTNVGIYSQYKPKIRDHTKVTIRTIAPKSVTMSAGSATIGLKGKVQLNATVLPANAANKKIKWTTSNKKIATVSSNGLVTAKKKGSCTITATTVDGGKKASCKIKVVKVAPTPVPTAKPTPVPTVKPTPVPTVKPTPVPTPKPTPVPTPTPTNKVVYRALLIGNNDYPGTENDLAGGPYFDVIMMENALSRSSLNGIKYTDITDLADLSASQIISAIAAMKNKGIDSNDVTLFYYSGHGGQMAPTEADTGIVGADNYLINVPVLKAYLDTIPGTVIVILDSCFSGMFIGKNGVVTKSAAAFNPKSFNQVIGGAFTEPQAKGLTTSKYHVITASRKNETSMNVYFGSTSDGYRVYVGLCTYYLACAGGYNLGDQTANVLYADANSDKIATIKEVYDFADYYVDKYVLNANNPKITQDMQYFTTNTSFPIFGRN